MTFFRLLLASSFVVGVAAGQQGLVVQPWSKPPAAKAQLAESSHAPASGLPPARAALPVPRAAEPVATPAAPAAAPQVQWTPPVVELLVDPWAKPSQLAAAPRPRWVPQSSDIIDPWANGPQPEPRVATSGSVDVPRETIF